MNALVFSMHICTHGSCPKGSSQNPSLKRNPSSSWVPGTVCSFEWPGLLAPHCPWSHMFRLWSSPALDIWQLFLNTGPWPSNGTMLICGDLVMAWTRTLPLSSQDTCEGRRLCGSTQGWVHPLVKAICNSWFGLKTAT